MQAVGDLTDAVSSLNSSCASELAMLLDLHEALMYEVGCCGAVRHVLAGEADDIIY